MNGSIRNVFLQPKATHSSKRQGLETNRMASTTASISTVRVDLHSVWWPCPATCAIFRNKIVFATEWVNNCCRAYTMCCKNKQ